MPQSIVPAVVKIAGTVKVESDDVSAQIERLIADLAKLEKQAELITGLELEEGDA